MTKTMAEKMATAHASGLHGNFEKNWAHQCKACEASVSPLTIGYQVTDMTTGRVLGVWHSVSERGAKTQAVKSTSIDYRYLSASIFVPVIEMETLVEEDDEYVWVEVTYGDESDHWTEKISADSMGDALELAREYIAGGFGNGVSVVKLVAIAIPEPLEGSVNGEPKGWLAETLAGIERAENADMLARLRGSLTDELFTPEGL